MSLESTIICIDNSEFTRNGDFVPTRLFAEQELVYDIVQRKLHMNPENDIALITMAGTRPELIVPLGRNTVSLHKKLYELRPCGEINPFTSIRIAYLAFRNRQSKKHKTRILLLIGSPLDNNNNNNKVQKEQLINTGKRFKKEHVYVDVVLFGSDEEVQQNAILFDSFVNSLDPNLSHLLIVKSGDNLLHLVLSGLQLIDSNASFSDSNMYDNVSEHTDPDLALALKLSMQDLQRPNEKSQTYHYDKNENLTKIDTRTKESARDDNPVKVSVEKAVPGNMLKNDPKLNNLNQVTSSGRSYKNTKVLKQLKGKSSLNDKRTVKRSKRIADNQSDWPMSNQTSLAKNKLNYQARMAGKRKVNYQSLFKQNPSYFEMRKTQDQTKIFEMVDKNGSQRQTFPPFNLVEQKSNLISNPNDMGTLKLKAIKHYKSLKIKLFSELDKKSKSSKSVKPLLSNLTTKFNQSSIQSRTSDLKSQSLSHLERYSSSVFKNPNTFSDTVPTVAKFMDDKRKQDRGVNRIQMANFRPITLKNHPKSNLGQNDNCGSSGKYGKSFASVPKFKKFSSQITMKFNPDKNIQIKSDSYSNLATKTININREAIRTSEKLPTQISIFNSDRTSVKNNSANMFCQSRPPPKFQIEAGVGTKSGISNNNNVSSLRTNNFVLEKSGHCIAANEKQSKIIEVATNNNDRAQRGKVLKSYSDKSISKKKVKDEKNQIKDSDSK